MCKPDHNHLVTCKLKFSTLNRVGNQPHFLFLYPVIALMSQFLFNVIFFPQIKMWPRSALCVFAACTVLLELHI